MQKKEKNEKKKRFWQLIPFLLCFRSSRAVATLEFLKKKEISQREKNEKNKRKEMVLASNTFYCDSKVQEPCKPRI
jgi:hypothetical protein